MNKITKKIFILNKNSGKKNFNVILNTPIKCKLFDKGLNGFFQFRNNKWQSIEFDFWTFKGG